MTEQQMFNEETVRVITETASTITSMVAAIKRLEARIIVLEQKGRSNERA